MSNNIRLRVNEQIRISPVRLIDHEKNMIGIVPTDEALRMAREVGLDLVEMSPNERPPVCRIMDYGKHKYQISKKSKQKHHEQKIKEVRLRPKTDEHDLQVKLKHARGFLEHGDRVLVTMLFRGRERFHQDIALESFREIIDALQDIGKVDQSPRVLGKKMSMVLAPVKLAPVKKPSHPEGARASNKPPAPKASAAPQPLIDPALLESKPAPEANAS